MISNIMPQLQDQTPDGPPGYAPTALSASSRPPAPPKPGETALDYPSAAAAAQHTGPPAAASAATAQTTPSEAQPGQGYGGGSPAGYAPSGAAGSAGSAPADFSSWYDPGRSGQAPGSGSAWSGSSAPSSAPQSGAGSGYPPPAGYNQPGWSGQASQQAPGAPAWSGGEYTPGRPGHRRRSGLGWKAAVAVLAIIGAGAGAATVVLLHKDHTGPGTGGNSTSAPPSTSSAGGTGSTLPPALLTTAINQPLTGAAPAGYKNLTKAASGTESAGFTIDYPTSWTTVQKGLYQTWLYAPQSNVNMLVDLTPHTYPSNMVQEAEYIESQSIPHFPGYARIQLQALTIRGTPGSFWKFTWTDNGVKQEALDFLFIQDNQSYALYATAPASMWTQLQATFDEEVRSFAPQPK